MAFSKSQARAHAAIAQLTERFPAVFTQTGRRPLKIGIHGELLALGFDRKLVVVALRSYCGSSGHLSAPPRGPTVRARRSAHRRWTRRGGEDCRGSTDREISPGEETTIGRRGGGREAGVRGDGKGASTGKVGRTSPALVERPSRAWATPQGVRHKAEGHYVLLRPLAALAQDEEPERPGGKTGGPDVKSSAIRHRSNHSTCSASATQ